MLRQSKTAAGTPAARGCGVECNSGTVDFGYGLDCIGPALTNCGELVVGKDGIRRFTFLIGKLFTKRSQPRKHGEFGFGQYFALIEFAALIFGGLACAILVPDADGPNAIPAILDKCRST